MMGAPQQEQMEGELDNILSNAEGLLIKQTMRGCCQECMGCEAKSEFKVAPMNWSHLENEYKITDAGMSQPDAMYALEKSSFCCRLCWRDGRGFKMEVSQGGKAGGQKLVQYEKPLGFPICCDVPVPSPNGDITKVSFPCCCKLPQLSTQTPGGVSLNSSSHYICDQNLCVPKIEYREGDEPVYVVRPETCCGGCCIACSCCSGKGMLYIPFYFHDSKNGGEIIGSEGYNGKTTPQIRKVWAGLKKECCSTADTFAVMFPPGISASRKAGLMGLTFLLDFTWFERQGTE